MSIRRSGRHGCVIAGSTALAILVCCAAAATQNLALALAPASADPPAMANAATLEQAGSIVLAVGTVTDTASNGRLRQLHDSDVIYSGDFISTGDDSYADLDFEDGGRMLLHPDTQFQIQEYHYDPAAHGYALAPPEQPGSYAQTIPNGAPAPAPAAPTLPPAAPTRAATTAVPRTAHESAFFRLFKGALSAISGFIGHVHHRDYAVQTPVATIGIRGTGYELRYCDSRCGTGQQGLYTGVGSGTIAIRNQAGESLTRAGSYGFVKSSQEQFRHLQHPPRALRHMRLPQRYRAREMRSLRVIRQRRMQRWRHTAAFGRRSRFGLQANRYRMRNGLHYSHTARRIQGGRRRPQSRHRLPIRKKHPIIRRHHRGPGR